MQIISLTQQYGGDKILVNVDQIHYILTTGQCTVVKTSKFSLDVRESQQVILSLIEE